MLKKIVLFLTPLLFLTFLFLMFILIFNRESGKGALQVTSSPQSQVYLDNKLIGKTPLCLCDLPQLLKVGEYDIKLIPVQNGFNVTSQKININKGALTVVDKTFDKRPSVSSGSLITLFPIDDENKSEILIISTPSGADVILDSIPKGTTPILLKDIPISDHEIKIIKDGYKEKIVKVKTVAGNKLEAIINLGIRTDLAVQNNTASTSANFSKKVIVLDTPTGFLRVRERDSLNSPEIGTVNPGDKLELISEKTEWFEVRLPDSKVGWISANYAKMDETTPQ
jgi:hypothetical protein